MCKPLSNFQSFAHLPEINLEHNNVVIRIPAMNFELKLDYETGDSDEKEDSFSAE